MSNVIKAYTVHYDVDMKKTIDSHLRIKLDNELKQLQSKSMEEENDEFVEGLNAIVIETQPPEEELKEKTDKIIEAATKEAEQIREQANEEAKEIKKEAFAAAQKQGYEEGILKGHQEVLKTKAKLEEQANQLEKQYEAMMEEMEPKMVETMSSLIEKITGIMVEDKKDVILYLVEKSLRNMAKCNEYTIKVANENYEHLSSKKNSLLTSLGCEASLHIIKDSDLKENQCLIETDLRVIDCSLDVQLSNLISDLKMLGGI